MSSSAARILLVAFACAACASAGVRATSSTGEETSAAVARAGGDEPPDEDAATDCAWRADAPNECASLPRHGRINRVYVNEHEELERLLAAAEPGSPEHLQILRRLAADYLELACTAYRECVTADVSGKPRPRGVARTARVAYGKHMARCAQLRLELADGGDAAPCK